MAAFFIVHEKLTNYIQNMKLKKKGANNYIILCSNKYNGGKIMANKSAKDLAFDKERAKFRKQIRELERELNQRDTQVMLLR